jgi:SP family general alpha glucoside:H+ symporter-like MFS transporter
MLNPTSWNWSGKTALVFAVASAVCFLWCYFRLPEPKGLTYLELDLLFQNKADRKKFKVL